MERAPLSSIHWLQQARLDHHWTQEDLAERIGVDVATVRRWELGRHQPKPLQRQRLYQLFGRDQYGQVNPTLPSVPIFAEERQLLSEHEWEGEATGTDIYLRFRSVDPIMRLQHLVWTWLLQPHRARYHELTTLLIQELEQQDNTMQDSKITRRTALRHLAALPIELYGLSLLVPTKLKVPEDFLATCAAGLTACWYLRKGKELTFAYDTVSRYIPTLQEIVTRGPAGYRSDAAELLSQCFILKSVLAWNVKTTAQATGYAQQAVKYSDATTSIVLRVTTLRLLAAALAYDHKWEQALQIGEQARYLLETNRGEPFPLLLSSYVYAGVATYQSHQGRKTDALLSLKKAHTTLFASPPNEVVPLWIDHSIGNLLLNDGLTHYQLGLYKQSIDSFSQVDDQHTDDTAIPFACRVETFIDQAMAEVIRDDRPRDMDVCIDLWEKGMQGVKKLKSSRDFGMVLQVYATMRAVWPGEQRIKNLHEQTLSL